MSTHRAKRQKGPRGVTQTGARAGKRVPQRPPATPPTQPPARLNTPDEDNSPPVTGLVVPDSQQSPDSGPLDFSPPRFHGRRGASSRLRTSSPLSPQSLQSPLSPQSPLRASSPPRLDGRRGAHGRMRTGSPPLPPPPHAPLPPSPYAPPRHAPLPLHAPPPSAAELRATSSLGGATTEAWLRSLLRDVSKHYSPMSEEQLGAMRTLFPRDPVQAIASARWAFLLMQKSQGDFTNNLIKLIDKAFRSACGLPEDGSRESVLWVDNDNAHAAVNAKLTELKQDTRTDRAYVAFVVKSIMEMPSLAARLAYRVSRADQLSAARLFQDMDGSGGTLLGAYCDSTQRDPSYVSQHSSNPSLKLRQAATMLAFITQLYRVHTHAADGTTFLSTGQGRLVSVAMLTTIIINRYQAVEVRGARQSLTFTALIYECFFLEQQQKKLDEIAAARTPHAAALPSALRAQRRLAAMQACTHSDWAVPSEEELVAQSQERTAMLPAGRSATPRALPVDDVNDDFVLK